MITPTMILYFIQLQDILAVRLLRRGFTEYALSFAKKRLTFRGKFLAPIPFAHGNLSCSGSQ